MIYFTRLTPLMTVMLSLISSIGYGQPPKLKMTTPVPEGIATPDKLETSIGTLTAFDGVPDTESTQKV
ncbi:MAG: hypothetical protein HON04_18010, partial [Planctomicrobium sp.]|nr:hypothetical protein [Planctomicrobium sp.]